MIRIHFQVFQVLNNTTVEVEVCDNAGKRLSNFMACQISPTEFSFFPVFGEDSFATLEDSVWERVRTACHIYVAGMQQKCGYFWIES